MSDLISRQVAIDAVTVWLNKARSPRNQSKYNDGEIAAYETAVLELKKIPSADIPQGEWIDKAISIIDDMQREGIIDYEQAWEFRMRARMKGADDE